MSLLRSWKKESRSLKMNNHKHKFVKKYGYEDKVICPDCEFELDREYYEGYVLPLEAQIKELREDKEMLMYGLELLSPEERESKGFWGRATARACKKNHELILKAEQAEKEKLMVEGYAEQNIAKLAAQIEEAKKEIADAKSVNDQLMLAVSQPELVLAEEITRLKNQITNYSEVAIERDKQVAGKIKAQKQVDELQSQNARLQKIVDSLVLESGCFYCDKNMQMIQQLSNQGDGK
jgi:hypothetical protein